VPHWRIESAVPGARWPALPAADGAAVLALLQQFEDTQWLDADELRALQMRQLASLLITPGRRAFTLRDHRWHRRDLGAKLAVLRSGATRARAQNWGPATHGLVATGPCVSLGLDASMDEQLAWLKSEAPDYLLRPWPRSSRASPSSAALRFPACAKCARSPSRFTRSSVRRCAKPGACR